MAAVFLIYSILFIIIVTIIRDLLLPVCNMPIVYLIYSQKPMEIKEINGHEMILLKRNAIENSHVRFTYTV